MLINAKANLNFEIKCFMIDLKTWIPNDEHSQYQI
jgi:hypothetical protein